MCKFNVGHVVVRSEYKNEKSAFWRDEMTIVRIEQKGSVVRPRFWYYCTNYRGEQKTGLASVMDECFELK